MAELNLTATDSRQQTVLQHLIPMVSDTLAEKINNGVYIEKDGKRLLNKKDLSTFMEYATEQAKNTIAEQQRKGAQAVCVHGDDIMSWAIHYFEEDRLPHDFQRWHDIRIDEYHTAKAEADEKERVELYQKFAVVAAKYSPLQNYSNADYAVFIAKSPKELLHEGDYLHHCVGRMGYDQKFVREETLIFFIRNIAEPETPFVTFEYSPKRKQVLQCYADRNTRPSESVLEFVNQKWLPFANRKIKKLIAAA